VEAEEEEPALLVQPIFELAVFATMQSDEDSCFR